jgi:16S rRNA G1207 methylase RsmC
MGANFTDYLKEAHRCLHVDGNLWIVEATSRFSNLEAFCDDLHKLGFDLVGEPEERGQFTFIRALKAARAPQVELKLRF